MTTQHHAVVRRAFAAQAENWGFLWQAETDPLLAWVAETLGADLGEAMLDVAAGTGLLGRLLASRMQRVTALDVSPAMLREGRRQAARCGITNITFRSGAAEAIPYRDGCFDLVTCRFAFHHVVRPQACLREMLRVCRLGGRLVLIDMLAPEDPVLAHRYNSMERLRDASHLQALTPREWRQLIDEAGLIRISAEVADATVDLESWLDFGRAGLAQRGKIRSAIERELASGDATGLRPMRGEAGRLVFRQSHIASICRKAE